MLECGVVVNMEAELLLKSTHRTMIVSALVRSIVNWCVRRP
ncbi:hypothetical protein [Candidatus Magnetobacterium casense]|nr:hypothetical protein [Candidatus Magnetobacterium casensis]